jgi:hypothetical protein
MRVHVDDARSYPLALGIDNVRACCTQACADFGNLAVDQQQVGIVETFTGPGKNGGARDERGLGRETLVAALERN